MRMAFLLASPMSRARPICAYTSFASPLIQRAPSAPRTPSGTASSTASGTSQLSYWAARTRNTKSADRAKTNPARLPASISWKARPDHSYAMPGGREVRATSCMAAMA